MTTTKFYVDDKYLGILTSREGFIRMGLVEIYDGLTSNGCCGAARAIFAEATARMSPSKTGTL